MSYIEQQRKEIIIGNFQPPLTVSADFPAELFKGIKQCIEVLGPRVEKDFADFLSGKIDAKDWITQTEKDLSKIGGLLQGIQMNVERMNWRTETSIATSFSGLCRNPSFWHHWYETFCRKHFTSKNSMVDFYFEVTQDFLRHDIQDANQKAVALLWAQRKSTGGESANLEEVEGDMMSASMGGPLSVFLCEKSQWMEKVKAGDTSRMPIKIFSCANSGDLPLFDYLLKDYSEKEIMDLLNTNLDMRGDNILTVGAMLKKIEPQFYARAEELILQSQVNKVVKSPVFKRL